MQNPASQVCTLFLISGKCLGYKQLYNINFLAQKTFWLPENRYAKMLETTYTVYILPCQPLEELPHRHEVQLIGAIENNTLNSKRLR